eukprot:1150991-Pelagomonas_calceolata.AAC.2
MLKEFRGHTSYVNDAIWSADGSQVGVMCVCARASAKWGCVPKHLKGSSKSSGAFNLGLSGLPRPCCRSSAVLRMQLYAFGTPRHVNAYMHSGGLTIQQSQICLSRKNEHGLIASTLEAKSASNSSTIGLRKRDSAWTTTH